MRPAVPAGTAGRIVLVTDGELRVKSARQEVDLVRGEAALLTAGEEVAVTGQGTAFVGGPGVF